ncbi:MAG TPA: FAD-dependent oxidoreductase [Pseudonocardiaceae bacterium]|jgi:glycine oxidase|nr:FAD-dependent oxidoreductase [Pseudonocardiaceae bacterium]
MPDQTPDRNTAGQTDVIVVGAGVVGASTARELARAGARVLLIDRDEHPGAGSRAAAGVGVPSVRLLDDSPMLEFALRGRQVLAADLARLSTSQRPLVLHCGLLRPVPDQAAADRLAARAVQHPDFLGSWLSGEELTAREPGWRGSAHGAFFDPTAAVVDAPGYVDALVDEARQAGVLVHTGCALLGVDAGSHAVTAHLPGGPVHAESLVLACGAWLGALPDTAALPVRPVRGQMIRLEVAPGQCPQHIVSGSLYLAPAPDGHTVLVGATEEDVEFTPGPTVEGALLLLAHAARNWGLQAARISALWHGFRASTPDGRPLIGRLPGAPRIVVAGGHGGQGILTGGHTGRLVTALLGGALPGELRHFDPARSLR